MNKPKRRLRMIMTTFSCMIAIASFILLAFAVIKDSAEPVEKFKVVDKYKNCTVVRYTDPTNHWHYLLHCGL